MAKESNPIELEQRVIRLVHANLMKLPAARRARVLEYLKEAIEASVAGAQVELFGK